MVLLWAATAVQASTGVITTFGKQGSGDGEFSYILGLDVDSVSGDVYVADAWNQRVQRFDAEGNFESAFGWGVADGAEELEICTSSCREGLGGSGPGQFSGEGTGPHEIAVDQSDGSVYVWDSGNHRVEKFDSTGNFLFAFGWGVADGSAELQTCTTTCQGASYGSAAGQFGEFAYANAVAVDPISGDVLVTDPENARVQEFDSSGNFVRMFGADVDTGGSEGFEICAVAANCKAGAGSEEVGGFAGYGLQGIDVDSTGAIYTADSSFQRMQKFTPSGATLTPAIFGSGIFPPGAYGPIAVAVDRSDDHVVAEAQVPPNFSVAMAEMDSSGAPVETYFADAEVSWILPLAFNPTNHRGYAGYSTTGYILGEVAAPEATAQAATDVTATTATLNGVVNSQGEPAAHYHFEYSLAGGEWVSLPGGSVPGDSQDHQVSSQLSPRGGLQPNSEYRVRVVAQKPLNPKVVSGEIGFDTSAAPPIAETVGSPFRTAATAQFEARINARNADTTYYFEYGLTESYGSLAPANAEEEAGSGSGAVLGSTEISGLQPGTTYHYRVVATNTAGAVTGEDRTLTTRADDLPLGHAHFPGPPGSDRAWELVSISEAGGNSLNSALGFSSDGNRALYQMNGGTPISDNGTYNNQLFAERTPSGWVSSNVYPKRGEVAGSVWKPPYATDDLSELISENFDVANQAPSYWRMAPGKPAEALYGGSSSSSGSLSMASDNGKTVLAAFTKSLDPQHSAPEGGRYLYDISSGTPEMVSLLPNGSVPACDLSEGNASNWVLRGEHWVSADGTRVFFGSRGEDCGTPLKLYMRDLPGHATTLVSGPAVSGPQCDARFIKSTATAVYFATRARLDQSDVSTGCEGGSDVYRYDIASGKRECLTCVAPEADVLGYGIGQIGVAEDDSRIYFTSNHRLLEGEGTEGQPSIYRVDLPSGNLAYVAPAEQVGQEAQQGEAMSADGSKIVFASARPELNALTGSNNGGTVQYYRYDDDTRSLVCVSCPVAGTPTAGINLLRTVWEFPVGPNTTPISDHGDFVFMTDTPLVGADQNTAREGQVPDVGQDVYEWRDGRVLLVSDGKRSWSGSVFAGPGVAGITPDGRDLFFQVSEQLTPDAVDGFKRLYDARIGGGFDFPKPPPPCPLEICQGEAKGAPQTETPGTVALVGPGNSKAPSHRHRRRIRKRCRHHGNHHCKRRGAKQTDKPGGSK
jgi:hypothetical protein